MPSSWKLAFITHNSLVNVSMKRIRLVYVLVVCRDSVSLHASASVGTGELISATWQNIHCWRGTCEKMVWREREKNYHVIDSPRFMRAFVFKVIKK